MPQRVRLLISAFHNIMGQRYVSRLFESVLNYRCPFETARFCYCHLPPPPPPPAPSFLTHWTDTTQTLKLLR